MEKLSYGLIFFYFLSLENYQYLRVTKTKRLLFYVSNKEWILNTLNHPYAPISQHFRQNVKLKIVEPIIFFKEFLSIFLKTEDELTNT